MKLKIYDCHETFYMYLRNISNITFRWSPCSIFYPFKNLVLTLLPSLFFYHHIHSWHSKCKLSTYIGNTHGCECVRMDRDLHLHHTIIIFNSMAYYSYILFRILFIFPAISFYSPFKYMFVIIYYVHYNAIFHVVRFIWVLHQWPKIVYIPYIPGE